MRFIRGRGISGIRVKSEEWGGGLEKSGCGFRDTRVTRSVAVTGKHHVTIKH